MVFGQTAPATQTAKADASPPTSLKWYAEIAKQRGLTSTGAIDTPEAEPVRPLKELIAKSLVIDGAVQSVTVDWSDGFQVFTWYRIKVFIRGPEPSWRGVVHMGEIPKSLPHAESDEIYLRLYGGTAVVDGITITMDYGEPKLVVGSRYLFFLEPLINKAYVSTYQSEPVMLDSGGLIDHSYKRNFSRRFDQLQSFQDVVSVAK
jgi:hypothetical protein